MGPPSPLDLSVEEFLARLKRDRRGTLDALERRAWRLTAPPVDASDFWELFDATVRDDGTVDLAAFAARGDSSAASTVVEWCLAAYVASDEAGVTMASARGVVTISVTPTL